MVAHVDLVVHDACAGEALCVGNGRELSDGLHYVGVDHVNLGVCAAAGGNHYVFVIENFHVPTVRQLDLFRERTVRVELHKGVCLAFAALLQTGHVDVAVGVYVHAVAVVKAVLGSHIDVAALTERGIHLRRLYVGHVETVQTVGVVVGHHVAVVGAADIGNADTVYADLAGDVNLYIGLLFHGVHVQDREEERTVVGGIRDTVVDVSSVVRAQTLDVGAFVNGKLVGAEHFAGVCVELVHGRTTVQVAAEVVLAVRIHTECAHGLGAKIRFGVFLDKREVGCRKCTVATTCGDADCTCHDHHDRNHNGKDAFFHGYTSE